MSRVEVVVPHRYGKASESGPARRAPPVTLRGVATGRAADPDSNAPRIGTHPQTTAACEVHMSTALVLIGFGIAWRLVIAFHAFEALGLGTPYNFVPIGAIALYAGARLPRRWAFAIPLAVLALSDLVIDLGHGYPFFFASRLTTYALFTAIVAMGLLARRGVDPLRLGGLSVAASTLFFLASNFAVWAGGEGYGYPMTWAGLVATYIDGLPFYRNSLVADLVGTSVLFGLDAVLRRSTAPDAVQAGQVLRG